MVARADAVRGLLLGWLIYVFLCYVVPIRSYLQRWLLLLCSLAFALLVCGLLIIPQALRWSSVFGRFFRLRLRSDRFFFVLLRLLFPHALGRLSVCSRPFSVVQVLSLLLLPLVQELLMCDLIWRWTLVYAHRSFIVMSGLAVIG